MMQRVTFSKGHSSFLIGKLNWTPLPFEAKRPANIPSKRYLHSAITYQGKLYILGGIDNDTDFKDHRMYCLQLSTMKWTIIEGKNYCEGRNSHACALFKNEIYFFGGSQQQSNPTNDFFKFSPLQATWSLIQCDEGVPVQRELAIMGSMNDQYLFLFGGIDILEDKIFDDAFLFKNGKWLRLNVSDAPSERIKMAVVVCQRRIFGFGGEGPGQQASVMFDNLYEIVIDQFDLEMSFVEVQTKGMKPHKRTAHAMVTVSPRFLLMYGGEGRLASESGNGVSGQILGDIWIYDVEEMMWTQIQTLFGSMPPRYQFSISLHLNQLFIFGGMNEQHVVIDQLAKLEFLQERQQVVQSCQRCQQQDTKLNTHNSNNKVSRFSSPQLSTGFYYNLAWEIVFPFRAVQIITEIAEELGSDSIRINSAKTIEQFDFLTFQFNSKRHLSAASFLNIAQSNQNALQAGILHQLKVAALRLGKTFLYVEAGDRQRRVLLMSADSRFSPNFEDNAVHYSYVEDLETRQRFHGDSYGDKQTIYNILRSQVQDPYSLLSRRQGSMLSIFQLNILPTVQKAYYYQLIFYSHPECDIKIYHNQKKVELLQTLGYCTNSFPDFSCRAYLKYSKLKRKIKVSISNDDTPVPVQGYLQYLRKQKNSGVVHELALSKAANKLIQKCIIFECDKEKYLQNNQGVLIYCGNHLIDRYDCRLGHIISDKFYKKKYKKKENLFRFTGVVYISASLKLNITKTKVAGRLKYNQILEEVIAKIKNARDGNDETDNEFGSLFARFAFNRESNKRVKRDNNA